VSEESGQSSLLTLVMRERAPHYFAEFFSSRCHIALCRAGDADGEDGRGQSVNLAVRTLPLLISIVVSIVAPHPIHPFSFLFPSAERRQVQVVVGAD
jgi:hypothetical protein